MKKEAIKEFFKPTKWKIMIFFLLIIFLNLIVLYSLLIYYGEPASCTAINCPLPHSIAYKVFPFFFIGVIILSYLISCILIWLFRLNKLHSKKHRDG
jgi:hypothetical protein